MFKSVRNSLLHAVTDWKSDEPMRESSGELTVSLVSGLFSLIMNE